MHASRVSGDLMASIAIRVSSVQSAVRHFLCCVFRLCTVVIYVSHFDPIAHLLHFILTVPTYHFSRFGFCLILRHSYRTSFISTLRITRLAVSIRLSVLFWVPFDSSAYSPILAPYVKFRHTDAPFSCFTANRLG